MLKFTLKAGEETRVCLGIEAENVRRLTTGQPIRVDMTAMGYPGLIIFIFYGETMGDLYKIVEPHIGPETKIMSDPGISGEV
jgi:hypothetical protein